MTDKTKDFVPAVFVPSQPPHQEDAASVSAETLSVPTPGAPEPSPLARLAEEVFGWAKPVVSAAVWATVIVTFGFQIARVDGKSMLPTLEDNDRLIVNKTAYLFGDPRLGDVVMHYWPEDPSKSFVKRIIAGPGDTVRSENGSVYRNDVLLDDSFIPEANRSYDSWGPEVVPKGYYFVMGDHRNDSSDSRLWGFVPKKYIIGKIQLRWWPLGHVHVF